MTMAYDLAPPVMIDFSGERCAESVRGLSMLSRGQLEAFLERTARASASVVLVKTKRPKPEKPRRRWRDHWR
jgi:hypothetical protein